MGHRSGGDKEGTPHSSPSSGTAGTTPRLGFYCSPQELLRTRGSQSRSTGSGCRSRPRHWGPVPLTGDRLPLFPPSAAALLAAEPAGAVPAGRLKGAEVRTRKIDFCGNRRWVCIPPKHCPGVLRARLTRWPPLYGAVPAAKTTPACPKGIAGSGRLHGRLGWGCLPGQTFSHEQMRGRSDLVGAVHPRLSPARGRQAAEKGL